MTGEVSDSMPVFEAPAVERRLLHDAELVKTVLCAFMQDLPRQVEELRELCARRDIPAAERQAHSIKGACANVGAMYARDLAFKAERAAHTADVAQLAHLIDALEVAQQPLYTALQDYIAGTE